MPSLTDESGRRAGISPAARYAHDPVAALEFAQQYGHAAAPWTGPQLLLLALLEGAVADYRRKGPLHDDAAAWFAAADPAPGTISFPQCCAHLLPDVEPEEVRRALITTPERRFLIRPNARGMLDVRSGRLSGHRRVGKHHKLKALDALRGRAGDEYQGDDRSLVACAREGV